MRTKWAVMIALLAMPGIAALPAAAEEELFDTKTAVAQMEKGTKLLHAKNYDAAIEAFEEAVAAAPSAEAHYLLGYAYYMKGKKGDEDSRQKAVENFEMAYEINPSFTPNKNLPPPPPAAQPQAAGGEVTPAAAAPAGKLEPAPAPGAAPAAGAPAAPAAPAPAAPKP